MVYNTSLGDMDQLATMIANKNPHCAQSTNPTHATAFQPLLHHGFSERMKYTPRQPKEKRSIVHRGQRKLLMSEIGLLVQLDPRRDYTVVYAGAAPGIHTPFLSELFPNVTFQLYDPSPFKIAETDRIKLFNIPFTDDEAKQYASVPNLVFICDIRRSTDEHLVWEDMQMQQRWHEIMEPEFTSLKFRLPWPEHGVLQSGVNTVEYLDGDIHLPIWGWQSTTESRLVIKKGRHQGRKTYDCLVYEEEMSFFNKVVRPSIHYQPVRGGGLDGCYDCTAEVTLLRTYVTDRGWGNVMRNVSMLSSRITRHLGVGITD